MQSSKIILFEINEVPYRVIDTFVRSRPSSALARALRGAAQFTTETRDEVLSPWVTWPTVHRGVTDQDHKIKYLSQDLTDVDARFPPVWKILHENAVRVGVFGSLHSWPPPADLASWPFYLPDTFAPEPDAHPPVLSLLQDFNLSMARKSPRNVSGEVPLRWAMKLARHLPQLGLKVETATDVGRQLIDERLRPWVTCRRRTYQGVLAFDAFLRQLDRARPDFSTFFTNHVASAMHRYWAALYPEDFTALGYSRDWIQRYRSEIEFAMGHFDKMLGRVLDFVDANPEFELWFGSSMGQAAADGQPVRHQLYIQDLARFARLIGAEGHWTERAAMMPNFAFNVADPALDAVRAALATLQINREPAVWEERERGFFTVHLGQVNLPDDVTVTLGGRSLSLSEAGMANVVIEDETGSNGYHVKDGSLVVYAPRRLRRDDARARVDTTQIAPALLGRLSVPPKPYMRDPGVLLN